jgi:hypothetical protein
MWEIINVAAQKIWVTFFSGTRVFVKTYATLYVKSRYKNFRDVSKIILRVNIFCRKIYAKNFL